MLPTPCARDWKGEGYDGQLPTTLALLPTPSATEYGNNQSPSEGAAVRPSLPMLVRLLPTPTAGEAKQARNATSGRREGSQHHSGTTLTDVAYEWSGATTSPPSDAGKPSTGLRLSPWFVEWMIGAPPGWSDPDCPLSATEFSASSASSPAPTSSTSSGSDA